MGRIHTLQQDPRNGNWTVRITRGKISKYWKFGHNKKEAEKALRQLECDLESGKVVFSPLDTTQVTTPDGKNDMRIEELIHRHLEWVEANRSSGTLANRQYYLNAFLDFMGPSMVSDITRIKIEGFYAWARKHDRINENAGNEHLRHVKTFLRWGEEMELIDIPFRRFPKIHETPPATKRIQENDLRKILQIPPSDIKDLLVFSLTSGLRPIEIRTLRKDNIARTDDGVIYLKIEQHKTARMTKDPSPRTVPLTKLAIEALERQSAKHPESPCIFVNADGDAYTRYALRNKLRRLCTKFGIKRFTPYACRHTFASLQSDAGIETNSLARLMGHSTTRTLRRYISNTLQAHKDAVDKVGDTIAKLCEKTEIGEKLTPNLTPRKKPKNTEKQESEVQSIESRG